MRVLAVDNHPLFLDGVAEFLCKHNPQTKIDFASTVEQAIARLDQGYTYDFILLGLNMPVTGMESVDLLTVLRERSLAIPTLIISAQDKIKEILRALDQGALGFISKSAGSKDLQQAIKCVMNGKIYIPDHIALQIEQIRRVQTGKKPEGDLASGYGITPKQYRVLTLIRKGYSNKQMAMTLCLSENTIKSHVRALFSVFNVPNKIACIKKVEHMGLD